MTLSHLPWESAPDFAGRPCIADKIESLSYAEFAARVDAAAEQFAERGVGPGSVVAVMLPNRIELVVSLVAAWRLRAAATPINPAFTATEANFQITDAAADLVVNLDALAPNGGRPSIAVADLRREPQGSLSESSTAPEDLALLIYTSGSTGRPKGVMLNHANIDAMARSMAEHLGLGEDDHCLLVLPLFHVNAICVSFLASMLVGARMTALERFHPSEFLAAIEGLRPTYFSAVPTIYAHLVSLPADVTADTSSVRFALCGAAPASEALLSEVEERFGFPLVEGYGLTEGTCASTANPVEGLRRLGTVGVALPGQTVAVMGPGGSLLPNGEHGEVVIQGANVMQGYLNQPEATAEALGDGWLHTGDIGFLDDDGYLRLVDRIKDMIIRGGENIYPKEIESVLHQHPAVLEAAVIGASDEVYGEVPVAYVALHPERTASEGELRELCAKHLTKVKIPVSITVSGALPKNPVGKIDKPAMRAQLAHVTAGQGA